MPNTNATTKSAAAAVQSAAGKAPQLLLERIFDASPDRVWRHWTDAKLYAKWIYPGKTDVAMHEFEAKVGGKVRFDMLLDTGDDMPNDGVFHLLDKPRRLEAGSPDRSFLLVANFEPIDGGARTRLRVSVDGVPAAYHDGARQGWSSCFDKLGAQLDAPGFSGPARGVAKDRYVQVTRWINASPASVYGAWTDAKMLPRFFWPVGTGRVDALSLKVGGELKMGHVDHPDWNATWRFTELVPGRRIGIIDVWPDGSGHEAQGTMEFTPENGGTRMSVRFGPFPSTGPYRPEDAASGSAMVADRLAEELETPAAGEGFRLVRTFNHEVAKVWQMWTTKEGLAKWWGPSASAMGFSFRVERLEVRKGGKYDIVMSSKEHGELHNHGEYLDVQQGRLLRQRWEFDIFLEPGEKPYPIIITIAFEEVPTWGDQKGTRMTFTQGPMAKPGFTEGSRQGVRANLSHLEKALGA